MIQIDRKTLWRTETVIYLIFAATLVGSPYVQRLRCRSGSAFCFFNWSPILSQ